MRIRTSPGEMLVEEFMKPLDMSAAKVAEAIGVPQNLILDIIQGQNDITADMASRLGHHFGTTTELWMNMQAVYDRSIEKA